MASAYALYAATAIFPATYVPISLRTVRRFPIERPAVAMLRGARSSDFLEKHKDSIRIEIFVKAGFPVTAATLVLSTVLIALVAPG